MKALVKSFANAANQSTALLHQIMIRSPRSSIKASRAKNYVRPRRVEIDMTFRNGFRPFPISLFSSSSPSSDVVRSFSFRPSSKVIFTFIGNLGTSNHAIINMLAGIGTGFVRRKKCLGNNRFGLKPILIARASLFNPILIPSHRKQGGSRHRK